MGCSLVVSGMVVLYCETGNYLLTSMILNTTQHLFSCPQIHTMLSALDLWRDPSGVAVLLDVCQEKLAAKPHKTTETDSPQQAGRSG